MRLRAGLSQDEVAVRSGIDSSNVRAYEGGRAMVSVQSLIRLADALDVAPSEFIDGLRPESFPTRTARPTRGAR